MQKNGQENGGGKGGAENVFILGIPQLGGLQKIPTGGDLPPPGDCEICGIGD